MMFHAMLPYAGEQGKQSEGKQLAGSGQIILHSTLRHLTKGLSLPLAKLETDGTVLPPQHVEAKWQRK